MEAVDNEVLHAYILVHTAGEPRSIGKGSWVQRFRSVAKVEKPIRSRNGDEPDWRDVSSLETNQNNLRQGCADSTGKNETRKHQEIT